MKVSSLLVVAVLLAGCREDVPSTVNVPTGNGVPAPAPPVIPEEFSTATHRIRDAAPFHMFWPQEGRAPEGVLSADTPVAVLSQMEQLSFVRTDKHAGVYVESTALEPIPGRAEAGDFVASLPCDVGISPAPNEDAPLAAIIHVAAGEPFSAEVEIYDGERQWLYRPNLTPAVKQDLVVLGLRPDRTFEMRVRLRGLTSETYAVSESLTMQTPPLPEDFPAMRCTLSEPERMEPGVTLFPVNLWLEDVARMDYGYFVAIDAAGEVVWYFRSRTRAAPFQVLENGHLLYVHADYREILEFDVLGNRIGHWYADNLTERPRPGAIAVDVDTLHHELLVLPNGNFLTASTELREFEEFYASEFLKMQPREPAKVVGDIILEFDPLDGRIVNDWHMFEIIDPDRIGYGSLSNFWKSKYERVVGGPTKDWSHVNAIIYEPHDDSMIISLRHQDCLLKLSRKTGEIVWMLGDPKGWQEPWKSLFLKQREEFRWPYHQHSPQRTPSGTILMFDNSSYRAIPFDTHTPAAENNSRVLELQIDEVARTVSQVWEYTGEPHDPFYSPFYGEADKLPVTGNILITDGGHIERQDGSDSDEIPADRQWARVLEVTYGTSAEKVFELVLDSGTGSRQGWSIYRSERVPSLDRWADLMQAELGTQSE
jgi:hypothetical protein